MKRNMKWQALILACLITLPAVAFCATAGNKRPDGYVWPTDEKVLKKIEQWKDLKYGVIFHWGLYSVPGILESWSLCAEDMNWNRRPQNMTYEEYKRWYWGLNDYFNPLQFDPAKWADLMKKGGMKYMIFTTKHHEGFCMFDTKETDFSVMNTPFGTDPRANVAKHVFEAFRQKDFMVGAYFSKPDWHCEYYWWPYFPTPNRNVNYQIKKYPERWEKFCQYTYNQIGELMNGNYGNIDILWLDGGQVNPIHYDQDIHMDKIAAMAREKQPGLIVVDRTVRGKFENYLTPEGRIPAEQMDVPWETCDAMNGWGWRKDGTYKSSKRIIATLIEVVSKGGNFLLGVGPTPQGTIDKEAAERIETIGKWMDRNGKGIYKTVNAKHYNDGNVWFTADKDGKTLYAFYALQDSESEVPETIEWTINIPAKNKVTLLSTNERVKCEVEGNKVKIHLPKSVKRTESLGFSFTVK